ncbi:hypothetical protein [Nonomuraea sp. NPDC049129]|uniref:sacsin N-terminal ATP-binding-like domain-containing protein n=1 Tax=Nonomuraea sp. NPDC049129 TaxID=3155272 RepID=UPI0033D70E0A
MHPNQNSKLHRARAAARAVYDLDAAGERYLPEDSEAAAWAVDFLGEHIRNADNITHEMADRSRLGAANLSNDRLQFLSEMIQNADDVRATEIRIYRGSDGLTVSHNGRPVRLADLLAMVAPWRSTKTANADQTGKFGIGLMTLEAISSIREVHSSPYHACLDGFSIAAMPPQDFPEAMGDDRWTFFHIPLPDDVATGDEILAWVRRWDHSALLFLRSVSRIVVLDQEYMQVAVLHLALQSLPPIQAALSGEERPVERKRAQAPDGRTWILYHGAPPSPAVERQGKAKGETVPITVALADGHEEAGMLYAGLPLLAFRHPVRVSAPFDPVSARQDLADTPWNAALVPMIGEMWVAAVADRFHDAPAATWALVPRKDEEERSTAAAVHALEEDLLVRSRDDLPGKVTFDTREAGRLSLLESALESRALERAGLLTPAETAALADRAAMLPLEARDPSGRWRTVIEDEWGYSPDVEVADALPLLEETSRPVEFVIALTALGLTAKLGDHLLRLPCVVDADDNRLRPPSANDGTVLTLCPAPLADAFGWSVRLHEALNADSGDARKVLSWLREVSTVIDTGAAVEAVRRLAALGRQTGRAPQQVTDEQLHALWSALPNMSAADWDKLAPDVGRAIALRAQVHDPEGATSEVFVTPHKAYLPSAYDRNAFSVAAAATPELAWIDARYVQLLRSETPRQSMSATQFLRSLGAETAPRLLPLASTRGPSYKDARTYANAYIPGSPACDIRAKAISNLKPGLTLYTLSDRHSPDLQRVLSDIADEQHSARRRRRAAAALQLLNQLWNQESALRQSWDRRSPWEVDVAHAYNGWQRDGAVAAFWVWEARTIAWLDNCREDPCRPMDLALRSPSNVAVLGEEREEYLHPELNMLPRPEVAAELGIQGKAETPKLIERLRFLREQNGTGQGPVPEETAAQALLVYRALAEVVAVARRTSNSSFAYGRTTEPEIVKIIRNALSVSGELVLTQHGWRRPTVVRRGAQIFGDQLPCVLEAGGCDELWEALRIPQPSVHDAIRILRTISKKPATPANERIHLECLRLLERDLAQTQQISPELAKSLRRLPLRTTSSWTTRRPVYAVSHEGIARELGRHVPTWQPGIGLDQFRELLHQAHVHEREASDMVVVEASVRNGWSAPTETRLFQLSVKHLRDQLTRRAIPPPAPEVSWEWLETAEVYVAPDLAIQVSLANGQMSPALPVSAFLNGESPILYVRGEHELARVKGVGAAIAALFSMESYNIAATWVGAWQDVTDDTTSRALPLLPTTDQPGRLEQASRAAEQHAQRIERAAAQTVPETEPELVTPLQESSANTMETVPETSGVPFPSPPRPTPPDDTPERRLIDPAAFQPVGPAEPQAATAPHSTFSRQGGNPSLVTPSRGFGGHAPNYTAVPPSFTTGETETVAFHLLRSYLEGKGLTVEDLRATRRVGADARDSDQVYYEIKSASGIEPDAVTLTDYEFERAILEREKYILVVVSGLEDTGQECAPLFRLIADPLRTLGAEALAGVRLTGVRRHGQVLSLSRIAEGDPELDEST